MAIQIGTVVRLKSGGPAMTVKIKGTATPNGWMCTWFVGTKMEEGYFEADQLEEIDTSEISKF